MERHDIKPNWSDPANNGGFGGKPIPAPATSDAEELVTDEPKEEKNERLANPKR